MENLFTNSVYSYDITKCNKTFILSFIAASFFCNIVTGTNVINENQFLPDSTNHEPYTYGDTVEICADGVDSIIYIYDGFNDTTNYERSISSKDIIVTLGNDLLPVQDGIFGVSLEAFFFDTHANEANNSHYTFPNPNPWQLLEMYAPKTLRFPGGAAGKFRHLLGSTNSSDTDNEFHDLKNGGYGINIEDVIDFYDLTDDEANRPVLFSTIVTDMDNSRDLTWILEEWKEQFGDVYDA